MKIKSVQGAPLTIYTTPTPGKPHQEAVPSGYNSQSTIDSLAIVPHRPLSFFGRIGQAIAGGVLSLKHSLGSLFNESDDEEDTSSVSFVKATVPNNAKTQSENQVLKDQVEVVAKPKKRRVIKKSFPQAKGVKVPKDLWAKVLAKIDSNQVSKFTSAGEDSYKILAAEKYEEYMNLNLRQRTGGLSKEDRAILAAANAVMRDLRRVKTESVD